MERVSTKFYASENAVRAWLLSFLFLIGFSATLFYLDDFNDSSFGWGVQILVMIALVFTTVSFVHRSFVQQRERAIFKAVVDLSLEFTYVRTVEGNYEYVSPAVFDLTGYTPEDFYSTPNFMDRIIHPDDLHLWDHHVHHVNDDGKPEKLEFRVVTKEGDLRWFEHLCGPVHNEKQQLIGVRSINIDITERKQASLKLERLVNYDALTDLPNRRYLSEYMSRLIRKGLDEGNVEEFAVLFVDLNRFKYVNDAHGHSAGDELLKRVAERFHQSCVESNKAMIARFGGDEFVFVTKQCASPSEIHTCMSLLNQLMEKPFEVHGHKVSIGLSAGVAIYPKDGVTPEVLIKNADAAMFRAKAQGLSMSLFSAEMVEHASEMVDIQGRLRSALNKGLIKPYYQPLVDLRTNKIMGVEVLARWETLDGLIGPSPGVFIPVSEETGLIWALSESMIAQAGQDIIAWQKRGVCMKYSVNVSARQFSDDNFCHQAIEQFERMGIDPASVQIELTESVLLNNIDRSLEKIEQLRDKGFSIALDDFGTGFASLHYLTMFPLDTLKIDRAFVTNILEDKRQYYIAKSIINLARELELTVVAEGIETEEQRQLLADLGCDIGQGYLFSKPIPPASIDDLLAA